MTFFYESNNSLQERESFDDDLGLETSMGKLQIEESRRVPGKGRIRASIEKLSGGVSKYGRISESTEKRYNPGEYRENVESMRV